MDGKYFTCEIHNERFSTVVALKEHVLQCHPKKAPLQCEVCNKRFKTEAQLERHKRSHRSLFENAKENTINEDKHEIAKIGYIPITTPNVQTRDEKITIAIGTVKREDNNTSFQCHICSAFLSGESSLNAHLLTHTTTTTEELAESENDVKPLVDREIFEDGRKSFSCGTCRQTFFVRKALHEHLKIHVKSPLNFSCHICNKTFGTRFATNRHISIEHVDSDEHRDLSDDMDQDYKPDEYSDFSDSTEEDVEDGFNKVDEDLDSICSNSSRKEEDWKPEIASNSNDSEDPHSIAAVKLKKTSKIRSKNTLTMANFVCYFCGKTHRYFSKHERHIWSHTNERPLHCHLCEKSFYNVGDLKSHVAGIHGTEKIKKSRPFKCHLCNNSFGEKSTLRRHMFTHSEKRPHVCNQCKKAYKRPGDLKKHIQSAHSIGKPFKCEICLKGFKRKDLRNSHLKLHKIQGQVLKRNRVYNYSEERPCRCKQCENSYKTKADLKKHIERVHSKKKV